MTVVSLSTIKIRNIYGTAIIETGINQSLDTYDSTT